MRSIQAPMHCNGEMLLPGADDMPKAAGETNATADWREKRGASAGWILLLSTNQNQISLLSGCNKYVGTSFLLELILMVRISAIC